MKTRPEDLAHPMMELGNTMYRQLHTGLTKREYFAVAALQGILSKEGWHDHPPYANTQAENAVRLADALIEELNKEKK